MSAFDNPKVREALRAIADKMKDQPPLEPRKHLCMTCNEEINGTIYMDDTTGLGFSRSMWQCKPCYLKSGHRECECGAFPLDAWKFCSQCGVPAPVG